MPETRQGFSSIAEGGLRMTSLPMRLFIKGNRKFWDPAEIDFSQDAEDWKSMTDDGRGVEEEELEDRLEDQDHGRQTAGV